MKNGAVFGALTFIAPCRKRGDNFRRMGRFKCICGAIVVRAIGRTKGAKKPPHCGRCFGGNHHPNTRHGMRNSPEYSSWRSMKDRCLNPQSQDYARYGAVGITLWKPWADSFEDFFTHIGRRPPGTTIDRIDTLKGYIPGNVRWADDATQQGNRRGNYVWHIKGQTFDRIGSAASHFGVTPTSVWRWVRGAYDARRKTFTQPRKDCHAVPKY